MSYPAMVYQVMIAFPSDIRDERDIACKVVMEWNYLNSHSKKIVLMPATWETHSAPVMGIRPQAALNEQVLSNSDLLIGIFWTRLGTPTGEADSGTVEEIEKHLAVGKPAMLYFSSAPLPQECDLEQFKRVVKFKAQCRGKGLLADYKDEKDFEKKLTAHLAKTVLENEYFKTQSGHGGDSALSEESVQVTRGGSELPGLSEEGKRLLLEAVQDRNGQVLMLHTVMGLVVRTHEKNMVAGRDARTQATWEAAVRELCNAGLLVGRGVKGEVFGVTKLGYQVADRLKESG